MQATRSFKRVGVFCGSSRDVDEVYFAAARHVGEDLARRGIGVVYGGGKIGLMGAVADAVLEAGGEAIGVIPESLRALEVGHEGLTELFVVESMHARKAMMAQMSDAFIGLPGGWGTLEELAEVTTWTQLNYHLKPVGLLNVAGYYDRLLGFIRHAADEGFIRPPHRELVCSAGTLDVLLEALARAEIPELGRWILKP